MYSLDYSPESRTFWTAGSTISSVSNCFLPRATGSFPSQALWRSQCSCCRNRRECRRLLLGRELDERALRSALRQESKSSRRLHFSYTCCLLFASQRHHLAIQSLAEHHRE